MALSVHRPAKRVRLNEKTNMQAPVEGVELGAEDTAAVRQVYLVTLPHPSERQRAGPAALRAPGTYTREELRDSILDACNAPSMTPRGCGGTQASSRSPCPWRRW